MLYMDQALYGMHVLGPYIETIREGMSRRDRLNYWLYKRAKGITLGSRYGGLPYIRAMEVRVAGVYLCVKKEMAPEFSELYYDQRTLKEAREGIVGG